MSTFFLLVTVDVTVGRVDKASLPHQALLDLVVQGIGNKNALYGYRREPEVIEEWLGVSLEDGKVTEIYWSEHHLQGVLHMEWLPLTVKRFEAYSSQLTGRIELSDLPPALESIDLSNNAFLGSIDMCSLKDQLRYLDISDNQLSRSLDLTKLPAKSHLSLFLNNNKFTGSLDLTSLPKKMYWLTLKQNSFSGTLDLSRLPIDLELLDLSENQFSGEVFIDAALFGRVKVENTKITKRRVPIDDTIENK